MKHHLAMVVFIFTALPAWCVADVTPNTCSQYLTSSDNAFYTAVSSNSGTATSIAQILEACSNVNICDQLSNVDNCAATLENRYFVSEYYAAANGNGPSGGTFGATASTNNGATAPHANTNANPAAATAPNKSSSKSDSSIHWF